MKTLIILNPHSGGGRAGKIFRHLEEKLVHILGDFLVAITHDPDAVARQLDFIASAGVERVIALGGDGTNFSILNTLVKHPELDLEYGTIPMGTGRDWARSLGIPLDPFRAAEWLGHVQPVRCDMGKVEYVDVRTSPTPTSRIFLNVASTGITRDVIARVNRAKRRTATCFLTSSIKSLLKYKPQRIIVECDGKLFFEGESYMLAVANGRSFGRGMWIAPDAMLNDGLFDVVIVEAMPRFKAIASMRKLYSGKHMKMKEVHAIRASTVTIRSDEGPIDLDLDGEEAIGEEVRFTLMPKAQKVLLDLQKAAIEK
jgi:YegS/Rv2252/BmrU family lipid kinase